MRQPLGNSAAKGPTLTTWTPLENPNRGSAVASTVTAVKPIHTVGGVRVPVTETARRALELSHTRSPAELSAMQAAGKTRLFQQYDALIRRSPAPPSATAPGSRSADVARPKNGSAFVPASAPQGGTPQ